MKNRYYIVISEISFYKDPPFTFMPDIQSPVFRRKRDLEKWFENWDNDIPGVLSYYVTYKKGKDYVKNP